MYKILKYSDNEKTVYRYFEWLKCIFVVKTFKCTVYLHSVGVKYSQTTLNFVIFT